MKNIAIIKYDVGNVYSLTSSLKFLGYNAVLTDDESEIMNASHIFLPGVGAFGDAMDKLNEKGLVATLKKATQNKIKLMGICLGMQLLFESSSEYGHHKGLAFLKGYISDINSDMANSGFSHKVPHMGWNNLQIKSRDNALVHSFNENDSVYFVHSFYAKNCAPSLVASCEYGIEIPAIVASENVFGCQFHPEKSGKVGLGILKAFVELN